MKTTVHKGILSRIAGFTLVLALASSPFAKAQVSTDSLIDDGSMEPDIPRPCMMETRVGIKGGLNMFNLNGAGLNQEYRKVGYSAGFFYNLRIDRVIGLRAELLASNKGGQIIYENKFGTGVANIRLNYIEMPILVQYTVLPGLNAQVGPYISYLAKASVTRDNSGLGVNEGGTDIQKEIRRNSFSPVDIGYAAGIEYTCAGVSFGFRVTEGARKVGNNMAYFGQHNTFSNFKNSNRQVYVGYAF